MFSSTMLNFQTAIDSTATALDSSGSAFIENERYMDSIEGKLSQLDSTWQLFSQQTISSDFTKSMIEAGTVLLEFVMQIGGLPTVISAATTAFVSYKVATNASENALKLFNLTAKGTGGVIGLVGAAITIGIGLWNSYNQAQEESRQATLDSIGTFENEIDTLSHVKGAVEEASTRDELITAIGQVSSAYADEVGAIDDLNEARERAIELIDIESRKTAEEFLRTNIAEIEKAREALSKDDYNTNMSGGNMADLGSLRMFSRDDGFGGAYLDFGNSLSDIIPNMELWLDSALKMDDAWKATNDGTIQAVTDEYLKYKDILDENTLVTQRADEAQRLLNEDLEGTVDPAQEAAEQMENYAIKIDELKAKNLTMADAIDTVNRALEDSEDGVNISRDAFQNINGEWDIATIELLELAGVLTETENGFRVNDEAMAIFTDRSSSLNDTLYQLAAGNITAEEAIARMSSELGIAADEASTAASTLDEIPETEITVDMDTTAVSDGTSQVSTDLTTQQTDLATTDTAYQTFSTDVGTAMTSASTAMTGFSDSVSGATAIIAAQLASQRTMLREHVSQWNALVASMATPESGGASFANGTPCYAGGTLGHNAVIDEHNKTEIVARNLGGRAVHLERGDAVLPNPTSVNLMNFGKNPQAFIGAMLNSGKYSGSSDGGVNVGEINISLPSVTDSQSFAKEITKTFKAISKQYSHARA